MDVLCILDIHSENLGLRAVAITLKCVAHRLEIAIRVGA